MGDKKLNQLHICLLDKTVGEFDSAENSLSLSKAKSVRVGIKEYEEELKQIEEKFEAKKNKVREDNKETIKRIEKEQKHSEDFIKKNYEGYLSGDVTAETYGANYAARKEGIDKRAAEIKGINDKLNLKEKEKVGEIKALNAKYSNVRWVSTVVRGSAMNLDSESFNESWGKGDIDNSFNFREFMEGGGFAYIEPFFQGDTPQGKSPYGLLVSAKGTPAILDADWRDGDGNKISEDIKVAFGSTVYLNIYTQALYGQEIEIALKDKGNWLSRTFNMNKKLTANQKAEGAGDAEELEIQAEKFTRGVDVHKVPKVPSTAIIGTLIEGGENIYDKKWIDSERVQMCQFAVNIDHDWRYTAGDELEIYPTVFYGELEQEFLDCKLMVHQRASHFYEVEKIESNQVAVYSDIETNVSHFKPCGYTKITSEYGVEGEEVTVFEQRAGAISKELKLQLIASDVKKRWMLDLENLNTDECRHIGTANDHNEKVISLSPGTSFDRPVIRNNKLISSISYPKPSLEKAVEMAWLPNIEPLKYGVDFATCRFQQHLDVEVYPDLEYELGFKLKMENPFYTGQTKAYTNRKYLGKKGFFDKDTNKQIRKTQQKQRKENYKNQKQEVEEGRLNFNSFEIAAEYSFGGSKQAEISIDGEHPFFNVMNTIMWVSNMVSNLSFSREADEAEAELSKDKERKTELNKRKKNHNKYLKKIGKKTNKIPLKIDVEGPAFAGAVAWKHDYSTKKKGEIGTSYKVKFKAEPLISVTGRLDLLFVASKIPYVGAVVKGLTSVADTAGYADDFWNSLVDFFGGSDKHKIKLDVDYYLDLYCTGSFIVEATATEYHTLDGFRENDIACKATIEFGIDCSLSIKTKFGNVVGEAEFTANAHAKFTIERNEKDGVIRCTYDGLYAVFSAKTNIENDDKIKTPGKDDSKSKKFLIHDGFTYETKLD